MSRSLLAALVTMAALAVGPMPSQAYTDQVYPWCRQSEFVRCIYRSLEECLADRQGLGGFCIQNPDRRR
jgi:hypothetical protein